MSRITLVSSICLVIFAIQVINAEQCPSKTGRYPDPVQCDAYFQCIDGTPIKKLCSDGLLFNYALLPKGEGECAYQPLSICGNRTTLQPANATEDCPRQFGFYRLGDAQNCGKFMNCANGAGKVTVCPEGLAFNKDTYRCDWPDETPDCDAEAFLKFSCPPSSRANPDDAEPNIKYFRSEESCQRFFTCVNGRPRLSLCGLHLAFNEDIRGCDYRNHVPGCGLEHHLEENVNTPDLRTVEEIYQV